MDNREGSPDGESLWGQRLPPTGFSVGTGSWSLEDDFFFPLLHDLQFSHLVSGIPDKVVKELCVELSEKGTYCGIA